MKDTSALGFKIPQILMPAQNVNLKKWSCVACDQFTSQPEYWNDVEKFVGNAPSTLHMVLPEIYLEHEDVEQRMEHLKNVMFDYLDTGVLEAMPHGVMLTERNIDGKIRKGILLAMDLEQYDYHIENKPLIRATEQTVMSRIPPRVKIRRDAPVEIPHIMLMIDDEQDSVIGALHMQRKNMVYDFDLMMDGGRCQGWLFSDEKALDGMIDAIAGLKKHDNMLFCVGDGNHSLATAKTIWDDLKQGLSAAQRENHPLRYALCEVINLRDRAVEFMPIHRVLFGTNAAGCAQFVVDRLREKGAKAKLIFGRWRTETEHDGTFQIPFLYRDGAGKITIEEPRHPLAIGEVQDVFDEYIKRNPQTKMDYIHGDGAFEELARGYDNIGFYFEALKKSAFFDTIVKCGVLPKKTFSLGEAEQKRYYLECRALKEQETEMEQSTDDLIIEK
ncbi:MAG: DUF1015 domain-containing protein [Christensenellaceae bacterium]